MSRASIVSWFAALAVTVPWLLYGAGLYAAAGVPEPAPHASVSVQLEIWQKAGGRGEPLVTATNPYTYVYYADKGRPDVVVASWVARSYLRHHLGLYGTLRWQLSGAALTIWLTRNWSAEQLLSKAASIEALNAG
jgi:hypothetical protein